MSCRPDLIIFDEPTTALDVTTQIEVLAAIKDIVEQFNTAAIYITHDLAVVAQMADRIMVLRYGDLVEEGERPRNDRWPSRGRSTPKASFWRCAAYRKEESRRSGRRGPCRCSRSRTCSRRLWRIRHGAATTSTFEDPRGRTVAVVGESGSGKSTLARAITGLLPPIEGPGLNYEGEALPPLDYNASAAAISCARLQMIYQMPDTALNPRNEGREIIGRPLELLPGSARCREGTRPDRWISARR